MNYLTAIIAVPIFFVIWLFELWLVWTHKSSIIKNGKGIVIACLVVSFLQMVSCWFWLGGFISSTLENVFSEGMKDGESMGCFGLVGAEVLLAIFQCIFTMLTIVNCWTMRNVYVGSVLNRSTAHRKMSTGEKVAAGVGAVILITYTCFAFVTAQNRRCKQGNHYLPAFQHHFYPIYLGIDVVSSLLTYHYCRLITESLDEKDARASVLSSSGASTLAPTTAGGKTSMPASPRNGSVFSGTNTTMSPASASKSTLKLMQQLARFYKGQTILSIIGGFFAVTIFIIQFVAKIEALSLIACIFCVCMYVIYAARRVPILIMYTHWQGYKKILGVICCVKVGASASIASSQPDSKDAPGLSKYSAANGSGKSSQLQLVPLPKTAIPTGPASPSNHRTVTHASPDASPSIGPTSHSQSSLVSASVLSAARGTPSCSSAAPAPSKTLAPHTSVSVSSRSPPTSPRAIRLHLHPSADFASAPDLAATIARLTQSSPIGAPLIAPSSPSAAVGGENAV